jgi:hypothetical protein
MLSQTLETEVARLDAGMLTDVQPMGQPGTTGSVFRARDGRNGGVWVAVKISHAEPGARRAVLNEEAVLSVPAIRDYSEPAWPGSKPLARGVIRRADPMGRVGLLLEWLDETFTPLETIAQESPVPLTEFQILRMLTPVAGLLAATHRSGYVYVDIGAQKADHFWWRCARAADGRWAVPLLGNRPQFQLKVIDWANALKIDDPGYPGDVTPSHDIAGLGELLFYLAHGPQTPIPDTPATLVGAAPDTLDGIIRRALFPAAPESFVQEAQHDLTATQRSQLLRDPARRAAATEALFAAMQARRDTLAAQQRTEAGQLVARLGSIQHAPTLAALHQALADAMSQIYGPTSKEAQANPTIQGERLLTALQAQLDTLRGLDPDDPQLPELADQIAAVEQLLQQRRALAAARLDLTKLRLDKARAGLATLTAADPLPALVAETVLLSSLTAAVAEASARPDGASLLDAEAMSTLVDQTLGSAEDRDAALHTLLRDSRWGSDAAVRAFRLLLGTHAPFFLLLDTVDQFSALAQEQAKQLETAANATTGVAQSALRQRQTDVAAARRDLKDALRPLRYAPGTNAPLPPLGQLTESYTGLVAAAARLEPLGVLRPADLAPLQAAAQRVPDEVLTVETALNSGALTTAKDALAAWHARDPQNEILAGSEHLLDRLPLLDWSNLAAQLAQTPPTRLPALLTDLRDQLERIRPQWPAVSYWAVLDNLLALTLPLADVATADLGNARLAGLAELTLGSLLHTLQHLTGKAAATVTQLANVAAWGAALPDLYRLLCDMQPETRYPPTPGDLQRRLKDQRILETMPQVPYLRYVYNDICSELGRIAEIQALTALGRQHFDLARDWLNLAVTYAPLSIAAAAQPTAQALSALETLWNTQGPNAALTRLSEHQQNPVVQNLLRRAAVPNLLADLGAVMREQNDALAQARSGLEQVPEKGPTAAGSQIAALLPSLINRAGAADDHLQALGGAGLRRPLAQDLEPLRRILTARDASRPRIIPALNAAAAGVRPEVRAAVYTPLIAALTWLEETAADPKGRAGHSTGPPGTPPLPPSSPLAGRPSGRQLLALRVGGAGILLLVAVMLAVASSGLFPGGSDPTPPPTVAATATPADSAGGGPVLPPTNTPPPSNTPDPTSTLAPSPSPTEVLTPTVPPSPSPSPSEMPSPSPSPSEVSSPTVAAPVPKPTKPPVPPTPKPPKLPTAVLPTPKPPKLPPDPPTATPIPANPPPDPPTATPIPANPPPDPPTATPIPANPPPDLPTPTPIPANPPPAPPSDAPTVTPTDTPVPPQTGESP